MKYRPIKFPRDEQAHECVVEWWYWNGRLAGDDGREYAFMDCLFKTDVKRVKVPFLAQTPFKILCFHHSIISDLRAKKWRSSIELPTILSPESFVKPLLYAKDEKSPYQMEETKKFSYVLKNRELELKLVSTKRPLLEGGKGFLDLHTKQTYYYSLTNLKTEGRIKVGGKWVKVKGKTWMDHQWADAAYSRDKWSWFSLVLSNGVEMVVCEYEDRGRVTRLAGIIDTKGRQENCNEPTLVPLDKIWRSPKTGAAYPTVWRITVPEKKIDLTVTAPIKNQEMIFGPINYWEGPINIAGKYNGKKTSGQGFMELAGYPSKFNDLRVARKDIEKKISSFFKKFKKK